MNIDPACGCGNFLIITYRELRRLELEVLKMIIDSGSQMRNDLSLFLKVNVDQFYGIEVEEFPAQIAQVGMWLMDHQMNTIVAEYFGLYYARLPLKQSATIVQGNALRIDWESVVPKSKLSYILGNPPFIGFKYASPEQKNDLKLVFGEKKKIALLDYVSAWYRKSAEYIQGTRTEVAFVSTNSIVQGTQVGDLWGLLLNNFNIRINFAHRTFKWNNEAKGKAAVHCVIVGFALFDRSEKILFEYEDISGDPNPIIVKNISPYLIDADDVIIRSRRRPLCDVPEMVMGNQAMDGGNLILEEDEYDAFLREEPLAEKYIKKYMMGKEFINKKNRYCLWLKDCPPEELRKMPRVLERVRKVQEIRANSNDKGARRLSNSPTLFRESRNPSQFIAIPIVSSERRNYIPIGFLDNNTIVGNKLFMICDANLYHFGVLTSNIHMSWMRAVGARFKSDYTYSKDIVYNNFPWPNPTSQQKETIEILAQNVLDVREGYASSSLADLYDPLTMPLDLVKAHNNLDRAVVAAYGGKGFNSEAERVADLMERYQELVRINKK